MGVGVARFGNRTNFAGHLALPGRNGSILISFQIFV